MKTKNDFKIGDQVSVINDTMTGKVIEIDHRDDQDRVP